MSTSRLTVAAALLLVTGAACSVQGTWVLCPDQPAVAAHDVAFNRITFNPDRSFQALTRLDGQRVRAAGTYEYDSDHERLTIRTGQRELVYKVRVPGDDRIVFLDEQLDGTVRQITMLRAHACPDCATCGPCGMLYRKYRPPPGEEYSLRPVRDMEVPVRVRAESACACGH